MTRKVVVTGVGAVTAFGAGVPALLRGLTGISPRLADEMPIDMSAISGGHFSRRELRRLARFTAFAVIAADEALTQAGLSQGFAYSDAVSCILGTGLGGVERVADAAAALVASALTVPTAMPNAAASEVCRRWAIGGESYAIGGACAAGTQAVGAGLAAIRSGRTDVAVVGGAEAPLIAAISDSFDAAGALSPTGLCRPFAKSRDGLVMAEGAGVLVLEAADHASHRGASSLGHIRGYGATSDAYHPTASPPGARPAATAIRAALTDAGSDASSVVFVNAHGTGTILNDAQEIVALRAVLGDRFACVPVVSTKSRTGHLFGAGGAVEAIASLHALAKGELPGNAGLTDPDPDFGDADLPSGLVRISTTAPDRIALSNSFGFGGHNAVLALGGAE